MRRKFYFLFLFFFLFQIVGFAEIENTKKQLQSISDAFIEVSQKIRPAVVNISTEAEISTNFSGLPGFPNDDIFRHFFGQPSAPEKRKVEALGSGFIISDDGYIITNYHVVKDATKIKVTLLSGKKYEAKVIGIDNTIDIALIKIKAKGLAYADLGDSDKLKIGQWVIAIGNPFGLNFSVTAGIVSALGRQGMTNSPLQQLIQTDAAINRGNSGGPLIDLNGNVIGINTAIVSRSGGFEGIGFAVPVNLAKNIIPQLKKTGTVKRGFLGITVQNIKNLKKGFHFKGENGALVSDITKNSPAEKSGMKIGDIIVSIDGKKVKDSTDLAIKIASHTPGDIIILRVWRKNKYMNIRAKLSSKSNDYARTKSSDKIGLKVKSLTTNVRRNYKIPSDIQGVIVISVKEGKFAQKAGLQKGDVLLKINNSRITTMEDYLKIIAQANTKRGILFYIFRNGGKIYSYYGE
ncbi:Do family serine endopeptidase [bacterium]|nr:Do family serine endopeptidase [bacterium]